MMRPKEVKSFYQVMQFDSLNTKSSVVMQNDVVIRSLMADTEIIERNVYEDIVLQVKIQDNIMMEIPLFIIDSQSRKELMIQNDLDKRVKRLELNAEVLAGRMTNQELEDELENYGGIDSFSFVPIVLYKQQLLSMTLTRRLEVPLNILLFGYTSTYIR